MCEMIKDREMGNKESTNVRFAALTSMVFKEGLIHHYLCFGFLLGLFLLMCKSLLHTVIWHIQKKKQPICFILIPKMNIVLGKHPQKGLLCGYYLRKVHISKHMGELRDITVVQWSNHILISEPCIKHSVPLAKSGCDSILQLYRKEWKSCSSVFCGKIVTRLYFFNSRFDLLLMREITSGRERFIRYFTVMERFWTWGAGT